ncbi:MAG: S41 family peptidase [Chloroflexales bacterium]|nr:S41 family peptidase [Chloroflexales bacterium]
MNNTHNQRGRFDLPVWIVIPMLVLMLGLGLVGGFLASGLFSGRGLLPAANNGACPLSEQQCVEFTSFWQAWQIAERNFVDEASIDTQRMTDGAIGGMIDSLGDIGHTRYLPPEIATEYQQQLNGKFEGIGAYIDVQGKQPLILQPIEGSPAEAAGIRPGDLILKVDGKDMFGVTVEELRSTVRGPAGTSVTLTVQHAGENAPTEITIARAEIIVPAVSWRKLPGDVALIRLTQFSSRSSAEMRQALNEARAEGARSVVLDLRNNPGGFVNELVNIASEFMPQDTVVLYQENRDGAREPYTTREGGVATDLPLVVLINGNSASAAEILAGALRDQGRARVIGEPTYGTATVLNQYDLEDGGRILLGTAQWLTPNGDEVRGVGIAPDEEVRLEGEATPLSPREAAELSPEALRTTDDTQLRRALEVVEGLAVS